MNKKVVQGAALKELARNDQTLGAEIIADYLIHKKVPYIVGVSGHGIMGMLDAFFDRKDKIKTFSLHHESAGPYIADAYYRITHRPLAAYASCGPGSSNLYIGVAAAQVDSSAMLVITGNVATSHWNKGTFQESAQYFQGDFVNSLRPYVKRSFQPTRADMLPASLRQAFDLMETGQTGPVHLDVPFNVFREPIDRIALEKEMWPPQKRGRSGADMKFIREALQLLSSATRPLIVAGHGVQLAEAEPELQALAEFLQIPVANTPMAKDVFDNGHPLSLGQLGRNGTYHGNGASRSADVILAIGTSFDDRSTSAWLPGHTYNFPKTKLIHIDSDPSQIGKNFPVTLGIVGDACIVLQQLIDTARESSQPKPRYEAWLADIKRWQEKWVAHQARHQHSDAKPIRPERFIYDLRRILPEDAILVADIGLHHNWLISEWQPRRPRSFLHNWGFGSMGFGVAAPIGAKLAAPDRPVVSVCGDGGFLMLPSAILTAVEYNLPVVWIVWNNYGYVSIRDVQSATLGANREIATSFRNDRTGELFTTDFAMMARSMGANGVVVEEPRDFAEQLEQAIRSERPTVLDVRMDREAKVTVTGSWELPPLPPFKPSLGWEGDR